MSAANFSMPTTCYIYTLHASNDPECRPRYVGFTTRLKARRKRHARGYEPARKGDWSREVIRSGGTVVLKVVHTFFSDDVRDRGKVEANWINHFRQQFPDLLNDKGGGGGLANCSPERRRNLSVAQLLYYCDPAAIEKNRQSILRYYSTPGAKEKSRQAALRRFSKASEIEKVSRIQKRRFSDPKEVEKNRRAILLVNAKKDLLNPPTQKQIKCRLACLKWKAKQNAKKLGLQFDEPRWLRDYKSLLKSIQMEAILETF